MNILVCISSVPDTTSKINFTDNNTKFDSNGVQFVINPYDEFGLTKAVFLKEENQAAITVLTVGDPSVEPILRKALAIGADKAIRINYTPTDSYSTAYQIANHINSSEYDLIIAGKESSDYNNGAVPGMIADMLEIPFINACNGLTLEGNNVKLTREIDGGIENIEVSLPAVVTTDLRLNEPRYASLPNIMKAKRKPIDEMKAEDLNIDIEPRLEILKVEEPKSREAGIMVKSVDEMIEKLKNEAKVI